MNLEKEVEFLKEKVKLLEQIQKIQDAIRAEKNSFYIPIIPICPQPYPTDPLYPYPKPWYGPSLTGDPLPTPDITIC